MTKRFQLAYNAIVDGYINGTLEKSNACSCACAHIYVAGQDANEEALKAYRAIQYDNEAPMRQYQQYPNFHLWIASSQRPDTFLRGVIGSEEADKSIVEFTGYSPKEFWDIEQSFEYSLPPTSWSSSKEERMFARLCNVIDRLIELDNVENKEELREGFKQGKKLQLTA